MAAVQRTKEASQNLASNYLMLADEFVTQYLITNFQPLVTSRLFSMGQSLELYAKSVLVSQGQKAWGHDLPKFLTDIDIDLGLSAEEIDAGGRLFSKTVSNFDMGLQLQYHEALELYQAEYHLTDLIYYYGKDELPIYPVRTSLQPFNGRYIELVNQLRQRIQIDHTHHDNEFRTNIATLSNAELSSIAERILASVPKASA